MKKTTLIGAAMLAAVCFITITGCATADRFKNASTKVGEAAVEVSQAVPAIVEDGVSLTSRLADLVSRIKGVFGGSSTNAPAK